MTVLVLASTSPTDFEASEAHRSIDTILSLGERGACLTHFDEVRDLEEVAGQLRAWIDRSQAWLEEATRSQEPVSAITARIEEHLRRAIADDTAKRGIALDAEGWKVLALDIALNAQGIAFVADKKRRQ